LSEPTTQIGKYKIVAQVGEGAMGIVYRATDSVLNRSVAIKVMSEGIAQDKGLRERFLREAQAAGSLQHPNVVTIYDFGETDGHLFIAMEYIEGADLEHLLLHKAPMTLSTKLDIVIDVLNGLAYAHRRGIVHRDIKPANVRVDEEGHARIMDFGVARLSTSNLTSTGVMMGTPTYMAPEQISGGAITAAVDLFSVGAMLYEILADAKPFQGETLHTVLYKIISESPPSLREVKPDLPAALTEIVNMALEKEPANRYKSAPEMANALTSVRNTIGAPRLSKTVSARVSIERGLQAQRKSQERAVVGRRWLIVAASAAALIIVAMGVLLMRRQHQDSAASHESSASGSAGPRAAAPAAGPAAAAVADAAPTRPSPVAEAAATSTKQSVAMLERHAQTQPKRAPRDSVPRRPLVATSQLASAPQSSPSPPGGAAAAPVSSPVPAAATPAPAPPPAAVVKPAAPTAENSRAAIASVIAAYARAIGTRDVAEVRRIHAGMTAQQQAGWESFFASVRSINATFDIASLDVSGSSAVARLTGMYEYATKSGRQERQPVSLQATLQLDGDRWTLQTVR
jgi:serine/threonine-protein kinase